VLAYGFTINRQFAAKTDRNSIFLGCDPHIPDRLYIMVLYLSFHGFSNFRSKSVCVSLQFYRKSSVCSKNWPKLRVSWVWPPYSGSVIHNSLVFEFWRGFKIFKFSLKIRWCWPTVLPKITYLEQKLTETMYFLVMTPIFRIGYT
jgi:hypothetical protein